MYVYSIQIMWYDSLVVVRQDVSIASHRGHEKILMSIFRWLAQKK